MQRQEFFLEIGAEEIPASYIAPAVAELAKRLGEELKEARIALGEIQTFATPRRLGVVISDLAEKGEDQVQEITGPPVRVAFNEDGTPKVPAQKFAEKVGLPLEEIGRKETPKGEYLVANVADKGAETIAFLSERIPEILRKLHFPKVMRWGTEKTAFVRPVHWICALLGGKSLSFSFAGIESGNKSRGHRFLAPAEFEVKDYAGFKASCEKGFVVIDPAEREKTILEQAKALAESSGGELVEDEEVLSLSTYLSEYPIPLLAGFPEKYLVLPPELIQTSVRHHLKSFVVKEKGSKKLKPFFIPVAGLRSKNEEVVRSGFQRVLLARLADAQFFYDEDRKKPLADFVPRLDKVVFQSRLGSYGDKVRRVETISKLIAEVIAPDTAEDAVRAAHLCKADLLSSMVYEFPELQGIMGRYYAIHNEEKAEVAQAILEHYLPAGQDDDVPESTLGQIVGLADRLDTLVGGFAVGMKPSGSADPYGLRRMAIGIIRTLKERKLNITLKQLLDDSLETLKDKLASQKKPQKPEDVLQNVLDYLRERFRGILLRDGWSRDLVDAVCVNDLIIAHPIHNFDNLLAVLKKAVESGLLAGLAYSFKRVNNILKAASKKKIISSYEGLGVTFAREEAPSIDESLLEDGAEKELYEKLQEIEGKVFSLVHDASFEEAMETLLQLHAPIEKIFDDVMIMAKDPALKDNRLSLMRAIARLAFIDFARISTESEEEK